MNLELIQRNWETDSQIDDTLLDDESLKIPRLHSKYLSFYNDVKLMLIKSQADLKTARHRKYMYYSGRPVEEETEPLNHKIMKSDVPNWVAADELVIRCEAKVEYNQTMLDAISEILRQINNRGYQIKNALDWRRFTNGL